MESTLTQNLRSFRTILMFVAAVAAAGYFSFNLSNRNGLANIHENAERRLDNFSNALFAPMDKYSYLPTLVANHPVVIDALLHRGDPNAQARANVMLERLNSITKTATIYIIDDTGMTIASSNWQDKQTFVGKNFSFRPYFMDAMRTGAGRFYGMGTTSLTPGYYLSHEIRYGAKAAGVAVVKIDLTNLDERWDRESGEMAVSDANGIVFLSSNKNWKYHPIRALDVETMENLMKTRQYEGVLKDPLPIVPVNKLGKDEQIIRIGEPREDQKRTSDYLLMSRKLSYSDWTLNLFIPLDENYAKALRTAVVSAGAVAFILLLVLYLHQATIRIRERERSRLALEEANHKLETKNRELQQVSEVLHQTSITDHLTGAYNRRFFLESLPKLISTASRHGHPLSILMIDVDNFKNINDKFGHPVGDKVLQTLAAICTEAIREADVFARFGGEEFIIALPDTEERAAHEVAERLRMAVINNPIDHNGALVRITISCGVSQYRPEDVYVEHVIKRADQALYAAKTSGRNRAVVQ